MNAPFVVTPAPVNDFGAAVFALGIHAPIEFIRDIEDDLRQKRIKGQVLFDLLPANGIHDRFYVAFFDGERFTPLQFKSLPPQTEVKAFAADFYKKNLDRTDLTLLPRAASFMIRKGVPV